MFLTFASSNAAFAISPDDVLQGGVVPGCSSWKDKGGQACDFKNGNHDFRIWKPTIVSEGNNYKINIKFDHKLRFRSDDHWYVSVKSQDGSCSTDIKRSNGGDVLGVSEIDTIARRFDEHGWEHALGQIVDNVEFVYCSK
ncbi:MAG: hypothetical protein HC862_20630 [Scytonema sp. RU_4_4]|nr:hypothetical protein [Scytonema sp. RU_4_4]